MGEDSEQQAREFHELERARVHIASCHLKQVADQLKEPIQAVSRNWFPSLLPSIDVVLLVQYFFVNDILNDHVADSKVPWYFCTYLVIIDELARQTNIKASAPKLLG